jgi:hypothetical protein
MKKALSVITTSIVIMHCSLSYGMEEIENIEGIERPYTPTLSPSPDPRQKYHPSSPLSKGLLPYTEKDLMLLAKKGDVATLHAQLSTQEYNAETLGKIVRTAIRHNKFNVFRYIMSTQKKCSIDILDSKGQTPLINAAKRASLAIVDNLIQRSADIELQSFSGDTALHKAACYGRIDILQSLLKRAKRIGKKQEYIEIKNNEGKTALFVAVEKTQMPVFEFLRNHKAETSVKDNNKNNLLHAAVLSGYLPILLNILSTTPLNIQDKNNNGETPLMLAQESKDKQIIRTLIAYKPTNS